MGIPFKVRLQMLCSIFFFMIFFGMAFGSNNSVIGMMISLAAFMNTANDLTIKPKLSFVKVLFLLLALGCCAFINNPVTVFGCAVTAVVVFATTMTSYHLFGNHVYIPYLMCYFMMVCIPVGADEFPLRLLALAIGAVFIVAMNFLANKNNSLHSMSKQTIDSLTSEIDKAVDMKLNGKEVSKDNFKITGKFYTDMFSNFEYKAFPSPVQESVMNIAKSFQYIGRVLANYDLTDNELKYIKYLLSNIRKIDSDDIYGGIEVETKEMNLVLLNFEYIADEIKNEGLTNEFVLPDIRYIRPIIKSVLKRIFSLESVRFTFALKMTFLLTLCEVLTMFFEITFPQWIYFAIIPLLMPYIEDMADSAKDRLYSTYAGIVVFMIIAFAMPYIPIETNLMAVIIFVLGITGFVFTLGDVFKLTFFATIMSVGISLTSLAADTAMELKLLWVTIATVVSTVFTYLVLPYSVKTETKRNLTARHQLDGEFIDLIRQKSEGLESSKGTSLVVINNLLAENIEITDENRELFDLQDEIIDLSNFISIYTDKNELSDGFKENLTGIIDSGRDVSDDLSNRERSVLYAVTHLIGLFKKEEKLAESLNY